MAAVALVVQKFGGTSVADPDRIKAVAEHIVRTRKRGDDVVVVALSQVMPYSEQLQDAVKPIVYAAITD